MGSGQAAALNPDYGVNGPSHPVKKGEWLVIYATGGGETGAPEVDGMLIGTDLPWTKLPVHVKIGGEPVDVPYAGGAYGLISGALQINAVIPSTFSKNGVLSLEVTIGDVVSQSGVTVVVGDTDSQPAGTGALIDSRFAELKTQAVPPALPEIPNDRIGLPQDWLGLISWNTQVGATSTAADALRPSMVKSALSAMFGGTYQLLAAQEVPSNDSSELLRGLLPGGTFLWKADFLDTSDTMDNGFWYREGVTLLDSRTLFLSGATEGGKPVADTTLALHPPRVAQFQVGDFDFTVLSVHLTFADGDTSESAREMRNILDYLDWYFQQPGHDPDVLVCGDFNTPSALSGQQGAGGITLDQVLDEDSRFQQGERRFVTLVHEPTSRKSAANGGTPANNYDHCLASADTMEELIQVRRVDPAILLDLPDDPEQRLTSDHFPIVAFFLTRGENVALDGKAKLAP